MVSVPIRRMLSELLEERQDPFMVDAYLLQNGYSRRILVDYQPAIMCWPGGNACRRLQRLSMVGFKRIIKKILSWESKTPENGKTCVSGCSSEMGIKTHDAEPRCLSDSSIGVRELDGGHRWRCMELSPVSVLELHSDEDSPFHNQTGKEENPSTSSIDSSSSIEARNISEELLEYPPSLQHGKTKRVMSQLDQLLLNCVREVEERIWDSHVCFGIEMTERIIQDEIISWGRQRGDVSRTTQLIGADLSISRNEWSQSQSHLREIGIEIAATLCEEIRDEIILDML